MAASKAQRERKKNASLARRLPKQERAKGTVDVILQAAARILEASGPDALTTNTIAVRAGVSIGSLYEYFPSKEAVLVALARRQLAGDRSSFLAIVKQIAGKNVPDRSRAVVHALLELESSERNVRSVTIPTLRGRGHAYELDGPARAVAEELARTDETMKHLSPQASFIVTRAVVGTVRAACAEDPKLLSDPEFEDELVRLVESFITAPRPGRW